MRKASHSGTAIPFSHESFPETRGQYGEGTIVFQGFKKRLIGPGRSLPFHEKQGSSFECHTNGSNGQLKPNRKHTKVRRNPQPGDRENQDGGYGFGFQKCPSLPHTNIPGR
jgi:hypothetical protein